MAKADETVFLWVNGLAGRFPLLDGIMAWVVSDYLVPVSLGLALVGLWFAGGDKIARQRNQIGVFVSLSSMGFSSLAVFTIDAVYFRPRPFADHPEVVADAMRIFYLPTDSSFPANAIAATFGLATAVWVINRKLGTPLLIGTGLYGFARVYAGVHYPLDIIAAALIAIAATFLTFKLRGLLGPLLTWVIKAWRIFCLA